MNKVIKTFSFIVISLFILSVFGWMSVHISKGEKKFGFLNEPVKFMYSFLDLFSQSVEEVKTLPGTFVKTPANFTPINKLDTDVNVLMTYSDTGDNRSCVLMNLKNDSVLYKWKIKNPYGEVHRILNPLLYPNKNLVYAFEGTSGLIRIDSLSNVIWEQKKMKPHHSMTVDSDGNIWVCSFEPVYYATGLYKFNGKSVFYIDNYITKINPDNGDVLFHKSVSKILSENNLSSYLIKSETLDPIHINDVEPALKSTKYYQEGDLFISARQPSFILHYRPSTNEVMKVLEGPFVSQHDVDFLTDNSLVLFNNNAYTLGFNKSMNPPKDSSRLAISGDFYSNIVGYDFATDKYSYIGDSIFRANKIYTKTEGIVEFLDPSTYFVEEQNSGLLWIIRDDEVIYKNVLKSQHEGYHHLPNWTRLIKNQELKKLIN